MHRGPEFFTAEDGCAMVTVTKKVYDELVEDQRLMVALSNVGVDCWDGYPLALAAYADDKDFEEGK